MLTCLGDFSALQIMRSGFALAAQVTNTVWNELYGPSYIVTHAFFLQLKFFSMVFNWRCWRSLPLSAAFWAASSFTWDICDVSISTADRFYLILAATWNRYRDADSVEERVKEAGRETKREHLARDVSKRTGGQKNASVCLQQPSERSHLHQTLEMFPLWCTNPEKSHHNSMISTVSSPLVMKQKEYSQPQINAF